MGLIIEVSFDICKNTNITCIKELLSNFAEKHSSKSNYFIYEIEGYSTIIERNDCINIVEFDNINEINIINYIRDITRIKFVKIDCIYQEKKSINLIYASKRYLFTLNKNSINPLFTQLSPKKIIELLKNTIY